jgi:hypothetical protein
MKMGTFELVSSEAVGDSSGGGENDQSAKGMQ